MTADDPATAMPGARAGTVVVFGPSPLLEVSVETDPRGRERVRLLPGGQAVWVSRMAATMGSAVTLCGMSGGRTGSLLQSMLEHEQFATRLVPTHASTGCFVVDQRQEPPRDLAADWALPPSAAEIETLVATTIHEAQGADVVVVCNPMPGDALPLNVYARVVAALAARTVPVVVDLSTPRLDAALRGGPAMVKLNDWELAELVVSPVDEVGERRAAMLRLVDMGARSVIVTRGSSSVFALDHSGAGVELHPPRLGAGQAAGCGDAMTGALAAALAQGVPWRQGVVRGMAAGAAYYVGRDEASRSAVDEMARHITWRHVPP